eukprot:CAMPEP_0115107964 /NCGR_PEP_ID=MMETSP0227-20121206/37660_1 /TAXON_ID=89957 /ORGANISM="Polarella glacialis, Strain CCMP 1383" /LENGTH=95 /DNA_ID=CAMNT_0002506045 /DNA_START=1185 /DNA_END=1472 /DNA_ORIENTATION=-
MSSAAVLAASLATVLLRPNESVCTCAEPCSRATSPRACPTRAALAAKSSSLVSCEVRRFFGPRSAVPSLVPVAKDIKGSWKSEVALNCETSEEEL